MLVKVLSSALNGIEAVTVRIEVNILSGAKFVIVGMPDIAVKESEQRIDSALRCIGYKIPGKRIIVNMAPADIRKEGSAYDLALALGILAADNRIPYSSIKDSIILGELSLDGTLNPIKGVLPIALHSKNNGINKIILPYANANEAAIVDDLEVYGFKTLKELMAALSSNSVMSPFVYRHIENSDEYNIPDFRDVKGQENVKRAMEIAACGGHNLIMIGSPGSGKTMLAKRFPSILPPMTREESLETTKIHSVAANLLPLASLIHRRPFRAPHHSISNIAMIGGGVNPRPGEISLANNGVLFLDELAEFKRETLEVLRQPLEERRITVSRVKYTVDYPANFILLASMNPCPCGYYGHPTKDCSCNFGAVHRYLSKLSGPLLDRIDIHVEVQPVDLDKITAEELGESSSVIRARVVKGREKQSARFRNYKDIHCNAQMTSALLRKYCKLNAKCVELLKSAMLQFGLSARAYDRIIKLSRTIADLSGSDMIREEHLAEAIQYRCLDRDSWGS